MGRFSIIIPTLQKNLKVLNMLVSELVDDETVGEVIIIDNSLKGVEFNSEKVRVITPKENLYVNPSWNLGVKSAKYEYIGILNDDILMPKNLCQQVMQILKDGSVTGLIGAKSDSLVYTSEEEFNSYPEDCDINLEKQEDDLYISHWGIAIFGLKNSYFEIPENIKIYCGDNYLIHMNAQKGNTCYQLSNCSIKHLGELSSGAENLTPIKIQDVYDYAKIDKRFKQHSWYRKKPNLLQRIFSIITKKQ